MSRQFFLDVAAQGMRMPIGTDLMLHEEQDPDAVRNDGAALGRVIERGARRWETPLAIPLMDLRLEKIDLLSLLGITAIEAESYHFDAPIDEEKLRRLCGDGMLRAGVGSVARDEALSYIHHETELFPVGMAIGPFSLVTRLLADPIALVAMAVAGLEPEESEEVKLLWQMLDVAEAAVARSLRSQMAHGARAVMVCEPTASTAFISPRQYKANPALFERLVMAPNLRVKALLEDAGCDLIFHDCGELTDAMVSAFGQRLHPVMLSLGSSRKLWEDARLVPEDVVLYGNLPSKSFYSDSVMPVEEVSRKAGDLARRMQASGHAWCLGTECDVLHVDDAAAAIRGKVACMMHAVTAG